MPPFDKHLLNAIGVCGTFCFVSSCGGRFGLDLERSAQSRGEAAGLVRGSARM